MGIGRSDVTDVDVAFLVPGWLPSRARPSRPSPATRCRGGARGSGPGRQPTVYQERNVNVSDVTSANPHGEQGCSAGSMTALDPDVSLRRLDWMGRHAFTARYAVRPV